jgi:hypothetical protein
VLVSKMIGIDPAVTQQVLQPPTLAIHLPVQSYVVVIVRQNILEPDGTVHSGLKIRKHIIRFLVFVPEEETVVSQKLGAKFKSQFRNQVRNLTEKFFRKGTRTPQ